MKDVQSEVARIRQQIETETQAMRSGLEGLAVGAKHEIIAHRYEAIGQCREQLVSFVGEAVATDLMIESYSKALEEGTY